LEHRDAVCSRIQDEKETAERINGHAANFQRSGNAKAAENVLFSVAARFPIRMLEVGRMAVDALGRFLSS